MLYDLVTSMRPGDSATFTIEDNGDVRLSVALQGVIEIDEKVLHPPEGSFGRSLDYLAQRAVNFLKARNAT